MNNLQDPFSIRNKPNFAPAFQLLRQPHLSSEVKKTARETVIPVVNSAVESAKQIAKNTIEDMPSFSIPKNIPSFTASQRDLEDMAWGSRFGRQQDLPLYKDKPYYSNSATGKRRVMRRKRFIVLIAALCFAVYWFGLFPRDRVKLRPRKPIQMPEVVDWDQRREKVKKAFVESWAAYERDAWGIHLSPVAREHTI
jgi:hypothetical protein